MRINFSMLFYYQPTKGQIMENQSDLVGSLARAQTKIRNARKDAKNSFLGNEYATLASVYDACRDALSSEGIAVVQSFHNETQEGKTVTFLKTSLLKGEKEICSTLPLQWIKDWHTMGSAITYARRYSLSALVGLTQADDDAGQASFGTTPKPEPKPTQEEEEPKPTPEEEAKQILDQVEGAEKWLADITGETDLQKMLSQAIIKRIINLGEKGIRAKVGANK
jgi:hypothetical protein